MTTTDLGATLFRYLSTNLSGVTVRADYISPTDNGPLPAVTYTIVSTQTPSGLQGVTDCFIARVEFTIHTQRRVDAETTSELVRQVMQSIPHDEQNQSGFITDIALESSHYEFVEASSTRAERCLHILDYFVSYRPAVLADLGL